MATDRFNYSHFRNWDVHLFADARDIRQKLVPWARLFLRFHSRTIVFSLLIGQPILIFIIFLQHFICNWLWYFVKTSMHCGLRIDTTDFRKCVRTITLDPINRFLYWYRNWHLEHQMFEAMSCYNLSKRHSAVANDMPTPRTMLGTWGRNEETVSQAVV